MGKLKSAMKEAQRAYLAEPTPENLERQREAQRRYDLARTASDGGRKKKRKMVGELLERDDPRVAPDWSKPCMNCQDTPVVPLTGMCGPCTFGEAETAGGNW